MSGIEGIVNGQSAVLVDIGDGHGLIRYRELTLFIDDGDMHIDAVCRFLRRYKQHTDGQHQQYG